MPTGDPHDPDGDEFASFQELGENVQSALDRLGIYVESIQFSGQAAIEGDVMEEGDEEPPVMFQDFIEKMKSGDATATMMVMARVGDRAWTDEVLHPEAAQMEDEARKILPSRKEMIASYIKEQLAQGHKLEDIEIPEGL